MSKPSRRRLTAIALAAERPQELMGGGAGGEAAFGDRVLEVRDERGDRRVGAQRPDERRRDLRPHPVARLGGAVLLDLGSESVAEPFDRAPDLANSPALERARPVSYTHLRAHE